MTKHYIDRHWSWIGGDVGVTKIVPLVQSFKAKMAASKGSIKYSPWMTSVAKYPSANDLISSSIPEGFINDRKNLELIARIFSNEDGMLKILSQNEARVKVNLDPESIRRTDSELKTALNLLFSKAPWIKIIFEQVISYIVPVRYEGLSPKGRGAFSQHQTKGVIYIQLPEGNRTVQNAIDLAHEIGHNVLMFYLSADLIITSDPDILVFSGARGVERPSFAALHSAMALAYMASISQRLHEDSYGKYVESLQKNFRCLRERCSFSEFGNLILKDFDFQAS